MAEQQAEDTYTEAGAKVAVQASFKEGTEDGEALEHVLKRSQALQQFKDGKLTALVATDIAARGIDIRSLGHVVNYDLPNVPEDYVHRIGRTGRAGSTGDAVSLVCADEIKQLRDIERLIRRDIPRFEIEGFEPEHQLPVGKTKAPDGRSSNQGSNSRGSSGRRGNNRSQGNDRSQGERADANGNQRSRPNRQRSRNRRRPARATA